MKQIFILAFLIWSSLSVFANSVTELVGTGHVTVIQEQENVVWYGTVEHGICRWDKVTETTTCFDTNNSSLGSNEIKDLFITVNGDLWASTTEAVYLFENDDWTVQNDSISGLFAQKANGDLNVIDHYNLATFDGSTWTDFDLTQVIEDVCCSQNEAAYVDENDHLWISHHDFYFYCVLRFDGSAWTVFAKSDFALSGPLGTLELTEVLPFESFDDNELFIDNDNSVWTGNWAGLQKYENNEWTAVYEAFNGINGVGETSTLATIEDGQDVLTGMVLNMTQDLDGWIWMNTGQQFSNQFKQLAYFDGTNWEIISSVFSDETVIEDLEASQFDENILYVGTNEGLLIMRKDVVVASNFNTTRWFNFTNGKRIVDIEETEAELWVATTGGLCRYDKNAETSFVYNRGNSDIPSNNITDLTFDDDGNIWVATDLGVGYFDGNNWTNFYDWKSTQLTKGTQGDVWILSDQLYQYNDGVIQAFPFPDPSTPIDLLNSITINENTGDVWMSIYRREIYLTYIEVLKFDGSNWTNYNHTNSNLSTEFPDSFPFYYGDILVHSDGTVWTSGENSLYSLNQTTDVWTSYDNSTTNLSSNQFSSIKEANNGDLWFGLVANQDDQIATLFEGGGVAHFDGMTWQEYNNPNEGKYADWLSLVHPSKFETDTYYFGTYGDGLFQSDLAEWNYLNTSNSVMESNYIQSMEYRQGKLWSIGSDHVFSDEEDIHVFDGQNWTVYDPVASNLPEDHYYHIMSDPNSEKVWIRTVRAYESTELYFFENDAWQLLEGFNTTSTTPSYWHGRVFNDLPWSTNLSTSDNGTLIAFNPPFQSSIFSINANNNRACIMSNDAIGTYDGQNWVVETNADYGFDSGEFKFLYFDGNVNHFLHDAGVVRQGFGPSNGLSPTPLEIPLLTNEVMKSFLVNNSNNYWIGTNKRLLHYNRNTENWTTYDTQNSNIPNGRIEHLAFDDEDNLWIGTHNGGLGVFNPNGLVGITSPEQTAQFRLFLEGPYQDNGTMSTHLQQENLIELSQPYGNAPYFYEGTESVNEIPEGVVDWVLVEARGGTASISSERSTVTLETKAVFLMADGTLQSVDGKPGVTFDCLATGEAYHFAIRHRNHLDIVTANPINLNETLFYDFTLEDTQVLGNEQIKPSNDGRFVLYAGDFNQDGIIQSTDYDEWAINPAILQTYSLTDANLDGIVQSTDYDMWFPNRAKVGIGEIDFD